MNKSLENHLVLDADDLFVRWGFDDGDLINQWWENHFGEVFDEVHSDDVDDHEVLADLVKTHLVPAIIEAGHTIEVYSILTIHNPIWAQTLDGVAVDFSAKNQIVPPVRVRLSPEDVVAAVERNRARSLGKR